MTVKQSTPQEVTESAPSTAKKLAMRDVVTINQIWEQRPKRRRRPMLEQIRIQQVHRGDKLVRAVVVSPGEACGERRPIGFAELRRHWRLIDS